MLPMGECSAGKPDDRCGCKRSLDGLESGKGTTTFEVVLMDTSEEELTQRVVARPSSIAPFISFNLAARHVRDSLRVAAQLDIGKVYERRGLRVLERVPTMRLADVS